MPLEEFWHGDIRLLEVYQKAYIRDKSYTAWLNGSFVFEAQSKATSNGNRTKQSDPIQQYNEWKDPIKSTTQITITKEEQEEEFRTQQAEQNSWLRNMMNT